MTGEDAGPESLTTRVAQQAAAIEHIYPQHKGTADLMRQSLAEIFALRKAERTAYRRGLERALELIEAEHLSGDSDSPEDWAYDDALKDAAAAIRAELTAHTIEPGVKE